MEGGCRDAARPLRPAGPENPGLSLHTHARSLRHGAPSPSTNPPKAGAPPAPTVRQSEIVWPTPALGSAWVQHARGGSSFEDELATLADMKGAKGHVATQEGYDRWSSCYDAYLNPLIVLEEPEVQAALGPVAGLDVLDLACGTGRHALRMAKEQASVTGVDFSEGMLSVARERDEDGAVHWVEHDLHDALPFESGSFDRVVHALALEHLDGPVEVLGEIRRVLRPTGHAVISVMHPSMFLKGTQARFVDPKSGDLITIASRRYTIADFVMAVRAADLELLDIRERLCTGEIAAEIPRAEKYVDWPMLLLLVVGHRA